MSSNTRSPGRLLFAATCGSSSGWSFHVFHGYTAASGKVRQSNDDCTNTPRPSQLSSPPLRISVEIAPSTAPDVSKPCSPVTSSASGAPVATCFWMSAAASSSAAANRFGSSTSLRSASEGRNAGGRSRRSHCRASSRPNRWKRASVIMRRTSAASAAGSSSVPASARRSSSRSGTELHSTSASRLASRRRSNAGVPFPAVASFCNTKNRSSPSSSAMIVRNIAGAASPACARASAATLASASLDRHSRAAGARSSAIAQARGSPAFAHARVRAAAIWPASADSLARYGTRNWSERSSIRPTTMSGESPMPASGRGSSCSDDASTPNTSATAYASSNRVSRRSGEPSSAPHAAPRPAPGAGGRPPASALAAGASVLAAGASDRDRQPAETATSSDSAPLASPPRAGFMRRKQSILAPDVQQVSTWVDRPKLLTSTRCLGRFRLGDGS